MVMCKNTLSYLGVSKANQIWKLLDYIQQLIIQETDIDILEEIIPKYS